MFDAEAIEEIISRNMLVPPNNKLLDFPAVNGRPVTQAHANICAKYGHATHTVNGVVSNLCPRCGNDK
jgi:hypothetical protein